MIEYLKARLEDPSLSGVQRKLIEEIIANIKKWIKLSFC